MHIGLLSQNLKEKGHSKDLVIMLIIIYFIIIIYYINYINYTVLEKLCECVGEWRYLAEDRYQ